MDQGTEIQPSTGKQVCCSMDRFADSDYESGLSNIGIPEFENINTSDICPITEGSFDSSLFRCLQSLEFNTQTITASCAISESRSVMPLCIDKSLNPEIANRTSRGTFEVHESFSSSSPSNKSSTKISVNCELEPSTSSESLGVFENCCSFPSYVGHRGSEYITSCLPHASNVLPSMFEYKLGLSDVVCANSSSAPLDRGGEIRTSSGEGCSFSMYPSVVPDSASVRPITGHGPHSSHPEMLENTGSLMITPNIERSHNSSSSFHGLQSMDVITRITKEAYSSFSSPTHSPTKALKISCDWECDVNPEIFKDGNLGRKDVEQEEFDCESNTLTCRSNVFRDISKHKQVLPDAVVLNSSPHDHAMDRSEVSCNSAVWLNEFKKASDPDVSIIYAEGSRGSSPIHFSKSVGVDAQIITSDRAISLPKTLTSPHVDSCSYGVGRSNSLNALGILNSAPSSLYASDASVKETMISNNSFTSTIVAETKVTYTRDSLNYEDDQNRIEVTLAKSEPRSVDVAGTNRTEVTSAKSEPRSMDVAGKKGSVIEKSVPMSCSLRKSDASMKDVSVPAQINLSEPTIIEPKSMKSPSTGRIPKQVPGLIRAKSEPKFTTSKPESPTTFFAGAVANRGMIVRSISLDMLDSMSLGMSSQPKEARCCKDCRQMISQSDIDDTSLQDRIRIECDGMLTRDENPREEEDVKAIIKLEPIDNDYCWSQSIDASYDEHLCHIKYEPPDELRLKNCRVALEKLPSHTVESYLQERPQEHIRKKKRRLWEPKTSNKKRKTHSKSRENVTTLDDVLKKSPARKFIVQERPQEHIRRKKRGLWEPKTSNKKRKTHSLSRENVTTLDVVLKKSPASKFIANRVKLKECKVVRDKPPTDPIHSVKLRLKECRVVLEKLPNYKFLCHYFGIQDCSVVLNILPDYQISSLLNSGIRNCSVVLNRLPDYQVSSSNSGTQDCSVILHRLPDYQISPPIPKIKNCKVVLQKLPEREVIRIDEVASVINSNSSLTRDQVIFCSQCPYNTTSKNLYQKRVITHICPKGFGEALYPSCGFFNSSKIENHHCNDTGLRKCKFYRLRLPVEKMARHLIGKHKELSVGFIQCNANVPFACYECSFMTGSKAKLKYHEKNTEENCVSKREKILHLHFALF